ncbi:hypothetical protein [Deinococcus yavapaiensis]|uniref:Uncharacterized protein n=1 Tax=Deinococcus yavapaiensis KR-236 TaxID=694435 RepID=A0A318RZC3_9DEIO|nr:hypothetical protein [Deinococcus yavapaiensis]PYE48944.1 hypothetical protein DES52_12610 [Deinococcus yavapaiensis KR-236]
MDRRLKFVLWGLLCVAPLALARPVYRSQAINQLHVEGSKLSTKTMACTYCHVNPSGGAPWNSFGEALKKGFRENPKAKFDEVLYLVLTQSEDSDEDGYPDVLEVFAKTLPGDANSKPTRSLAELREAFEAAGGVKQYESERMKKAS